MLCLPAGAETVFIRFRTSPPGAIVSLNGNTNVLGRADGSPLQVELGSAPVCTFPKDFRTVWQRPHDRLVEDAQALQSLHRLLPEDPETARRLFDRHRGQELPDVQRELALVTDVDLMERSLQDEFSDDFEVRRRSHALTGEDYPFLLRQHRAEALLEDEARALAMLREALPSARDVFQLLQDRLRKDPGGDVLQLAQSFLRDYLVTNDRDESLRRVGQSPEAGRQVGQQGDGIVVGGVRLPSKRE